LSQSRLGRHPIGEINFQRKLSSAKLGRPDANQFGRTDEKGHFDLRGMNPGELLVLGFGEIHEDYRTPKFVK
jgi:hypothetical protein